MLVDEVAAEGLVSLAFAVAGFVVEEGELGQGFGNVGQADFVRVLDVVKKVGFGAGAI